MKKSRGIIILLVTILLIGGLGYITAFGIGAEKEGAAEHIKLGLDLAGGVSITYKAVGENPSESDMSDTIYKLQKRVEGYSTEAQVYPEGSDRINVEIPGVSDANAILAELGKPGSLLFIDKDQNVVLTGTDIKSAQAGSWQNSMGNVEYMVELTMTEDGAKKFADATTKAAVNNDVIYIIYDNAIVSAPTVENAITGGQAQITKMESFESAETLASTIRIGSLKLELEELRSNVVGAQLGTEAINTSLKAGMIGFGLVIVFMLIVYLVPGIASALALFLYVALILILLNLFEITLTLPGIAGIILSIGMAVDANVIIFARIKEELGAGKTVRSAIKIGFQKALSAILDGNITTLIAALVLAVKGSGGVKGFAQTLALGIVVSMFTALVITRLLLQALYAMGLQNEKLYGVAKEKKAFDFLGKKRIFFGVSIALVLSGFVFMGLNTANIGSILNYGLEFKGGTATNVTFNEDMTIADIDTNVVPAIEEITGDGNVQSQKVAGTNEVIFKTRSLSLEEREALNTSLAEEFKVNTELITAENIGSTISSEMKGDAVLAVIIATICMLIYVWFRFKDIRFAASAVLALCHDVLVVLAFYAVARVSVGSTFIACMLTIVGYSINATIVVFDRIRENMGAIKRNEDIKNVVNVSITQTLTRSVFTSLTTFIMVAVLYVMGVTSIKEFALPLMVGIICGTYSSVCITGALWYVLRVKFAKKA